VPTASTTAIGANNNLQWLGGTYYHKFNDQWHITFESWYMYARNVPDVSQGYGATAFAYVLPTNRPNESPLPSGELSCTAKTYSMVSYLNYQFSPLDNISLRGEFMDDIDGWRTGTATAITTGRLAGSIGSRLKSRSVPKSPGTMR